MRLRRPLPVCVALWSDMSCLYLTGSGLGIVYSLAVLAVLTKQCTEKGLRNGNRGHTRNALKTADASRLSKQTRFKGRGSSHSTKLLMYFPHLFTRNWGGGGSILVLVRFLLRQEETHGSCFDSVFRCRLRIPGIYERSPPLYRP